MNGLLSEGQQRDVPGPLNRNRQQALMLGTGARLPSRLDLPPVGNVPAEPPDILIVDRADLIHAEIADLTARIVPSAPTKAASRAVITTSTSASTAWAGAATLLGAAPKRAVSTFFCHVQSSWVLVTC
jgi:hypothetical protein